MSKNPKNLEHKLKKAFLLLNFEKVLKDSNPPGALTSGFRHTYKFQGSLVYLSTRIFRSPQGSKNAKRGAYIWYVSTERFEADTAVG